MEFFKSLFSFCTKPKNAEALERKQKIREALNAKSQKNSVPKCRQVESIHHEQPIDSGVFDAPNLVDELQDLKIEDSENRTSLKNSEKLMWMPSAETQLQMQLGNFFDEYRPPSQFDPDQNVQADATIMMQNLILEYGLEAFLVHSLEDDARRPQPKPHVLIRNIAMAVGINSSLEAHVHQRQPPHSLQNSFLAEMSTHLSNHNFPVFLHAFEVDPQCESVLFEKSNRVTKIPLLTYLFKAVSANPHDDIQNNRFIALLDYMSEAPHHYLWRESQPTNQFYRFFGLHLPDEHELSNEERAWLHREQYQLEYATPPPQRSMLQVLTNDFATELFLAVKSQTKQDSQNGQYEHEIEGDSVATRMLVLFVGFWQRVIGAVSKALAAYESAKPANTELCSLIAQAICDLLKVADHETFSSFIDSLTDFKFALLQPHLEMINHVINKIPDFNDDYHLKLDKLLKKGVSVTTTFAQHADLEQKIAQQKSD